MTSSASFSIYGIGPFGADFKGIMPGNIQAIMSRALKIRTNFGKLFLIFIFYLQRQGNYKHLIIGTMNTWQTEIKTEFDKAAQARDRGNEGQARVCARRAAGIAAREYFMRRGIRQTSVSAYDLLNLLKNDPDLPPELRQIADHLTLRVSEDFKLPVDADLVAEAKQFCEQLLTKIP
jgi:hypothetical protein